MTLGALEDLVAHINAAFIPLWTEHDPRIPPHGRVTDAAIRRRADGEYEVTATLETFEAEDDDSLMPDGKEMIRHAASVNGLTILYGWEHQNTGDQADIDAIAEVLRSKPSYHAKKAADPINIVTIAGAFILGGIASGFLKEIGSDGWKLLKTKLASLLSRDRRSNERLLSFQLEVEIDGQLVDINVIHTNPTSTDIDEFLESGLAELDKIIPIYLENQVGIRRLVFEAKGKDLQVNFAVRKDCRPLVLTNSPPARDEP